MGMEGGIDPASPLDYVELQIFPNQNRYEAFVCSSNMLQKVASGILEQLLLHSTQVKDLSSKGSNTNFKILRPDNVNDAEWFTTTTLTRFLHIIGSPDILSIGNEISQLEETRKFQLSLSIKAEVNITSSIDSKNELLRAVDLRLTALKDELAGTFNQATGGRCSTKDISDLENFAHHFGAKDIRDSLQRFVDMSIFPSNKTETTIHPPIRHDVSSAKVERQNSTDDENSSNSSEEDQPSVERSRAPIRSATPRRSASPMRRIQIGRSGSRRAAALTIKSLNYFPSREKAVFQRDTGGNSSEEEDPEKPSKNNVLRMSVQDKISLFESKQKEQGVEVPKTKTLNVVGKKAVLRRWSSGMGVNATQCLKEADKNVTQEAEPDNSNLKSQICGETEENVTPKSPGRGESEPLDVQVADVEILEPETEERYEKHPDTIEWCQQKEVELNELFMKMIEDKQVRQGNVTNDITTKSKKSTKEQKGGSYDHYKQKRDEKLRGEAAGKKAEKEAQFKVMQRFVDEKKSDIGSTNADDVNKKQTTSSKPLKTQKNSTPLINPRKEALKPSVLKKATSKTSPLPATRKSWPSAPSAPSASRTPMGPTSATRKPQSTSSAIRSSTKSENSKPRSKTLKTPPSDVNRTFKTSNEKKQPIITKSTKTTKAKVRTPEIDTTAIAKPSFYNKVTRKSSVVPLETKPFLRKGSRIGPGVVKTKAVTQPLEASRSYDILILDEENEEVTETEIIENNEECKSPEIISSLDPTENKEECKPKPSPIKCEESPISNKVNTSNEVNVVTEEELMISPSAWVEVEEEEEEEESNENEIIPFKESPVKTKSPVKVVPAGNSSPRIRQSLSQMLLEDHNEADISEWGNAEHPPALVYQKDSPKGFKRLLKFARKTKTDLHQTSWSSPSTFSEGDDDTEEIKGQSNISRMTSQNHVSASVNSTKATRSFFSLSTFRGSKTHESKVPQH